MEQFNLSFDPRNDVFWFLNAVDAEKYVGQYGYFGNSLSELETAINLNNKHELVYIYKSDKGYYEEPFAYIEGNGDHLYRLFIPAYKVKTVKEKKEEKEKNWRPFALDEFNEVFEIGHTITFRKKDSDYRGKWLYTGYATGSNLLGKGSLYLGAHVFILQELFDEYEYQDESGNWNLFGLVD